MRIVFLDIDGVLNTEHDRVVSNDRHALDPALVARLDRLVEEADALIVVTSSYRLTHSLDFIAAHLKICGLKEERRIIDRTPAFEGKQRGHEIASWLADNTGVERFVILDDWADLEPLMDHLVQTDHDYGLSDSDVERALHLLGAP